MTEDPSTFSAAKRAVIAGLNMNPYEAHVRLAEARRSLLYESDDPILRASVFLDRFWTPERRAFPDAWINRDE